MHASSLGKRFWKSGKVLGKIRLATVSGIGGIPQLYEEMRSSYQRPFWQTTG
jgi:hypothetical protein